MRQRKLFIFLVTISMPLLPALTLGHEKRSSGGIVKDSHARTIPLHRVSLKFYRLKLTDSSGAFSFYLEHLPSDTLENNLCGVTSPLLIYPPKKIRCNLN